MKKFFSKASKENNLDLQQSFIGKIYTIAGVQYVVEEVIAEGGFAIVFLVRSCSTSKRYALKRMFVNNEQDLAVCKREIHIYSSLSGHKNIITFINSAINRMPGNIHEVLILMKYYKGSLMNQMNEKIQGGLGYTEEELIKIFCDVCEAVSRLHHCLTPIVHRDLKIENILVDDDDRPTCLLCDFGSATAKIVDPMQVGVQQVEDELAKYTTISYRSPEMVDLYSGKVISTKADIWALGCMFYKLCYSIPPFADSALAIQSGNYVVPEPYKYSQDINTLLRYMMTVNPNERPDIYQVSYLVFKLAGLECPVPNLHNSLIPSLNQVPSISQKFNVDVIRSRSRQQTPSNSDSTTSVIPRERPKGSVVSSTNNPSLPLLNPVVATTPRRKKPLPDSVPSTETNTNMSGPQTTPAQQQQPRQQSNNVYPGTDASLQQQQLLQYQQQVFSQQTSIQTSFQQQQQHPFSSDGNYFQATVNQSTNPFLDDQTMGESIPSAQGATGFFSEYSTSSPNTNNGDVKGEDGEEAAVIQSSKAVKESSSSSAQNPRHRRNISDISLTSFTESHRFSAYHKDKSRKVKIKSSDDGGSNDMTLEEDRLPNVEDEEDDQKLSKSPKRPLSADITDWNPFNEDNFENSIFGREFDRINRGSNSSISGVKSREDLVMSNPDISSTNDPFSAAPLGPLGRMKKLAIKKSRAKLDPKEDGSSSSVEGDGYSKLKEKDSSNQETKAGLSSKIPLVGSYINSSATGQSEAKQTLMSQSVEGQPESTVGRAASVSHDIFIGTARLVKRAVGGASDMYKQFVEPSSDDMGVGIFGKTHDEEEEEDEDGKSNNKGNNDSLRDDAERKRRLEEVKDILERNSAIDNLKKEDMTSDQTSNLKEKLLAGDSSTSVAKQTNGKQSSGGLASEPSKSFFKAGLFQFASKDGMTQNAQTQQTVTFQKLQNDDETTIDKMDLQEMSTQSERRGADGPASSNPESGKLKEATTSEDSKSKTSKPAVSLLKNPFASSSSKVGEARKLSVPNILSFVGSGGGSGTANAASGSGINENTSLLGGEGSKISSASSSSSSSFKLPFQTGFDVFGAAPFRKKKLPQQQSKKSSEKTQHKALVNQPSDGSLKSPVSPRVISPDAANEDAKEDPEEDDNYFPATFDAITTSTSVTSTAAVVTTSGQSIKKSASPFSNAIPIFSFDSLRSKTSKKEFSLLKNEHSVESFASLESFNQNPPAELTPVSQGDVSAVIHQINQVASKSSNAVRTTMAQDRFVTNFESKVMQFAKEDQHQSQQQPLTQYQTSQTISFQSQHHHHQQQSKNIHQTSGQMNHSWVSFEQNLMATNLPRRGNNPFLEEHRSIDQFLPTPSNFNNKNEDDNDEACGDDDDDEQGKLFSKKEQSKDKQRSKSLFDQSQVPKMSQSENKKIGPGLSFAEDQGEVLMAKERHSTTQHHWFHHVPSQSKSRSKTTPSSEFANLGFTDDPDAIPTGSTEFIPPMEDKKSKGKPEFGFKKKKSSKVKETEKKKSTEAPSENITRDGASPDYPTPSKADATPTHHHTLPRAGSKKNKSSNQNFTLLTQSANAQSDNSVDSSNIGVFSKVTYV